MTTNTPNWMRQFFVFLAYRTAFWLMIFIGPTIAAYNGLITTSTRVPKFWMPFFSEMINSWILLIPIAINLIIAGFFCLAKWDGLTKLAADESRKLPIDIGLIWGFLGVFFWCLERSILFLRFLIIASMLLALSGFFWYLTTRMRGTEVNDQEKHTKTK